MSYDKKMTDEEYKKELEYINLSKLNNAKKVINELAMKYDSGKPRWDLLSTVALNEVAKVLTFGATKYNDHNWRKGFDWSRLIAASLRHVSAFNDGEDKDQETGISHIAHAMCCLMFLLEHEIKGLGKDNRYKGEISE